MQVIVLRRQSRKSRQLLDRYGKPSPSVPPLTCFRTASLVRTILDRCLSPDSTIASFPAATAVAAMSSLPRVSSQSAAEAEGSKGMGVAICPTAIN